MTDKQCAACGQFMPTDDDGFCEACALERLPSLGLKARQAGFDLTPLELELLEELFDESAANGHDFGVTETLVWKDKRQLGGLLTSLQSKGVITGYYETEVDDEVIHQYDLSSKLTGHPERPA